MKAHIKDGTLGYTLNSTDIKKLVQAANILELAGKLGHKNAGDTARLVRGIATAEECAAEPEKIPLTFDLIEKRLDGCAELKHVAELEADIENSNFSDDDRRVSLSWCDKRRSEIKANRGAGSKPAA